MCGIVGYVGGYDCKDVLMEGLSKLEYRGYDSAGVALHMGRDITVVKAKGRLVVLKESWKAKTCPCATAALAIPAGPPMACPAM